MKIDQQHYDDFKSSIVKYTVENVAVDFDYTALEDLCGLTKFSISRRSRVVFSAPPMRWVWRFRLHLFETLLRKTHSISLTELGEMCGFNSLQHLSTRFKATYKRCASRYPRGWQYGPLDIDEAFEGIVRQAMDDFLSRPFKMKK